MTLFVLKKNTLILPHSVRHEYCKNVFSRCKEFANKCYNSPSMNGFHFANLLSALK